MKNIIKILLMLVILLFSSVACGKPSEEEIRSLMENHLLEKYGEPFEICNLGIRDANGQKYYTAQIYPKSFEGTGKEYDKYYDATVNIDILSFGKLDKVGDTYGDVITKEEAEKYLLPKAKEIFGEKIRIMVIPELEEKEKRENRDAWIGWVTPNFQFIRDKIKNDPDNFRLKLDLYIYIFDKIDNEKEERRQQIFDFIQYLKKEKLFKYLMLDVLIINEEVLESKEIVGKTKNKLRNINTIQTNDLTDETIYTKDGFIKNNIQFYSRIYSENNLKEVFTSAYELGEIKLSHYEKISDIELISFTGENK